MAPMCKQLCFVDDGSILFLNHQWRYPGCPFTTVYQVGQAQLCLFDQCGSQQQLGILSTVSSRTQSSLIIKSPQTFLKMSGFDRNNKGSFEFGSQVTSSELHRFLSFPTGQNGRVFHQKVIFFGGPFEFVVFLAVHAVEGADVSGYSVQFADDDGESGAVLAGEDVQEFCQLSHGEVFGRQLHFGVRGGHVLGVDFSIDVRQQVLHLSSQLHSYANYMRALKCCPDQFKSATITLKNDWLNLITPYLSLSLSLFDQDNAIISLCPLFNS